MTVDQTRSLTHAETRDWLPPWLAAEDRGSATPPLSHHLLRRMLPPALLQLDVPIPILAEDGLPENFFMPFLQQNCSGIQLMMKMLTGLPAVHCSFLGCFLQMLSSTPWWETSILMVKRARRKERSMAQHQHQWHVLLYCHGHLHRLGEMLCAGWLLERFPTVKSPIPRFCHVREQVPEHLPSSTHEWHQSWWRE